MKTKSKVSIVFILLAGLFVQGGFFVLAQDGTTATQTSVPVEGTTDSDATGTSGGGSGSGGSSSGTTSGTGSTATAGTGATVITVLKPYNNETISGTFMLSAQSSVPLNGLAFYFDNPESQIQPDKVFSAYTTDAGKLNWEMELNSSQLPNGTYTITPMGKTDASAYVHGQPVTISLSNIPAEVRFTLLQPQTTELSGDVAILIETDILSDAASLTITGAAELHPPVTLDGRYIRSYWPTRQWPNGEYALEATVQKYGRTYRSNIRTVRVNNAIAASDPSGTGDSSSTVTAPAAAPVLDQTASANTVVTLSLPDATQVTPGEYVLQIGSTAPLQSGLFIITSSQGQQTLGAVFEKNAWHARWPTGSLANGDYAVMFRAQADGKFFESEKIIVPIANDVPVQNQTKLRLLGLVANTTFQGTAKLVIELVAGSADRVKVFVEGEAMQQSLQDTYYDSATGLWLAPWDTRIFPNGTYKLYAGALVGTQTYMSEPIRVFVNNEKIQPPTSTQPPPAVQPATPQPLPPVITDSQTPTSFEQKVQSELERLQLQPTERSEVLMRRLYSEETIPELESECVEAKVQNPIECKKYLLRRAGVAEDCLRYRILEPAACADFMKLPSECKNEGVFTSESCKRFLIVRYGPQKNLETATPSGVCTGDDPAACQKTVSENYLPLDCRDSRVTSFEACQSLMLYKYFPAECTRAEAKTNWRCNEIIKNRYFQADCERQKISGDKECFDYIFERYVSQVECVGLDPISCQEVLRRRHLASAAVAVKTAEQVNAVIEPFIKNQVVLKPKAEVYRAGDDIQNIKTMEDVVPIKVKQDKNILLIPALGKNSLSLDDTISAPANAALMYDADADGLPDDIEARLGTDAHNPDSDQDGYTDGVEVENKFNPLGPGAFEREMSPSELAIVDRAPLEHPKITGQVSSELAVLKVENASESGVVDENRDRERNVYQKLSGRGIPGQIVVLYIYSDLPIVVTTAVDQYGNWTYALEDSLKDGDHEVYVTINDQTGRVVSKSNPFSFFVREAQAVTASEFFVQNVAARSTVWEQIRVYLVLATMVTLGGIMLFVFFLMQERKKNRY